MNNHLRILFLFVFKKLGVFLGSLFGFFPPTIKRAIAKILGNVISRTTGRLSSSFYVFGYEMVKYMYFGKHDSEVLTKIIFGDIQMELDVTQKTQRILYLQKVYEPYITNYLLKTLKRGDVFIDVGANVGVHTLLAAKLVGKEGIILSFEPEKNNYTMLIKNLELNHFTNVIPIQKAVGDKNTAITLYLNPLNEGGHSLMKLEHYQDDEERWSRKKAEKYFDSQIFEQKVEVTTLDDYLKRTNVKIPRIVKMDIEGAELMALKGMPDLLGNNQAPDLICEVSQDGGDILDLLNHYGYGAYILDNEGNPHVYTRTNEVKVKALLFSKMKH